MRIIIFNEDNENYTDAELNEIEFNLQHGLDKNIKSELIRIGRPIFGYELSDVFFERDGVQPEIDLLYIDDDNDEVTIIDIFGQEESFLFLIGSWRICTFYARSILSSLRKILC
jgi:hypothetical protein